MKLETTESKKANQVVSRTEKKYDLSGETEPLGRRRIMDDGIQLLRNHKYGELWQQCCGYIDLSLKEVMDIQKNLLLYKDSSHLWQFLVKHSLKQPQVKMLT